MGFTAAPVVAVAQVLWTFRHTLSLGGTGPAARAFPGALCPYGYGVGPAVGVALPPLGGGTYPAVRVNRVWPGAALGHHR